MIDSTTFISDAQLLGAYRSAIPEYCDSPTNLAQGLRAAAEVAIGLYLGAELPAKFAQLDRVTDTVERFTGEVLK